MKTCKSCGEAKPHSEFSRHGSTRDRLQTECKACRAEWLRRHRRENPDYWRDWNRQYKAKNRERIRTQVNARYAADPEANARRYLAWRVQRDFGLSLEEYDALVAKPCEVCGSTEGVVLDHCHETNVVRGPLCLRCNTAIGKLGDDPVRLRAAADYLERHA